MYATADRGARAPATPSGFLRPLAALRRDTAQSARGDLQKAVAPVLPRTWKWGAGLAVIGGAVVLSAAAMFVTGSVRSVDAWMMLVAAGALVAMAVPLILYHRRFVALLASLSALERREADLADEREELLHDAIMASDGERQRLAADLHDGVIQLVSAVTLRTATLARGLRRDPSATPEKLASAAVSLDRITADLQAVTADLRTLMGALAGGDIESDGLSGALSQLLAPLADRGVNVEITVGELDCDARVRGLIHRVAQELVRNAAKHARARRVSLTVECDAAGVCLRVADDGRGFDAADLERYRRQGHMGLRLLEQRIRDAGGHLEIASSPGHGTTAEMTLPTVAPRPMAAHSGGAG
ncbi:MAG: ATP-binding protein [Candidatus Dormibacteria bacterium]